MSPVEPREPRPDPLIDEIRAIRRSIAEQFNNDLDQLVEHLRKIEKQYPGPRVDPKPVTGVRAPGTTMKTRRLEENK